MVFFDLLIVSKCYYLRILNVKISNLFISHQYVGLIHLKRFLTSTTDLPRPFPEWNLSQKKYQFVSYLTSWPSRAASSASSGWRQTRRRFPRSTQRSTSPWTAQCRTEHRCYRRCLSVAKPHLIRNKILYSFERTSLEANKILIRLLPNSLCCHTAETTVYSGRLSLHYPPISDAFDNIENFFCIKQMIQLWHYWEIACSITINKIIFSLL